MEIGTKSTDPNTRAFKMDFCFIPAQVRVIITKHQKNTHRSLKSSFIIHIAIIDIFTLHLYHGSVVELIKMQTNFYIDVKTLNL